MAGDELIPVFIPALGVTLVSAEDKKGQPLTKTEVLSIRDNAPCMMMKPADFEKLEQSRGYDDIDPDHCWYDWQMLRQELGRKPDLDPGAKEYQVRSADPEYQATIQRAQDSLNQFRELIPQFDPTSVLVKTELSDGNGRGFVWLFNTFANKSGFTAELFEVPDSVSGLEIGQSFDIANEAVMDWMINDDGSMHGCFSLRYHRSRLTPDEQAEFDDHIGATVYL